MKTNHPTKKRGYTLVELSLAMGLGSILAGIALMFFNQQLTFIRIFRAQDFLMREAPIINTHLSKIVGNARGIQLYENMDALTNNMPPVMEDASVAVLLHKEPDGDIARTILSFENPGDGNGLYFRLVPPNGLIGEPNWAVSKEPADVTFSMESGIFRTRIVGPNGEEITYSGTEQL